MNSQILAYSKRSVCTYLVSPEGVDTYDELNRLKTVTPWVNKTASYIYDQAGRLTSVTNFNQTVTGFSYDKANRLTALQNMNNARRICDYKFEYALDNSWVLRHKFYSLTQ